MAFSSSIDLGGLDGTTGFRLNGAAEYDQSGRSVASAGDVNGDGYDDLIVGAPNADPNGTPSGASYVVFGGAFGDSDTPVTTTGTVAAEMLIGGIGADSLTGGGGADLLRGGAGNDRLVVSDLAFREADGGSGTDTLALAGTGLVLDLTTALAAGKLEGIERIDLTGSGANTLRVNSAAVLGGVGAVTGGEHVLTVLGNSGDAVLFAESGWTKTGVIDEGGTLFDRWQRGDAIVDVQQGVNVGVALTGGPGNDTLDGGDGADSLDGAAGADTLIGGWSADKLTGGADADVFVFRDARDSTRTSRDTIYDFTVGTDRIDFTQMPTGFHALQTVTSAPVTIDADSLVAVVSGGNTVLYVNDTDASQTIRNASMEIFLRGVTTLGDADLDYLLI